MRGADVRAEGGGVRPTSIDTANHFVKYEREIKLTTMKRHGFNDERWY